MPALDLPPPATSRLCFPILFVGGQLVLPRHRSRAAGNTSAKSKFGFHNGEPIWRPLEIQTTIACQKRCCSVRWRYRASKRRMKSGHDAGTKWRGGLGNQGEARPCLAWFLTDATSRPRLQPPGSTSLSKRCGTLGTRDPADRHDLSLGNIQFPNCDAEPPSTIGFRGCACRRGACQGRGW